MFKNNETVAIPAPGGTYMIWNSDPIEFVELPTYPYHAPGR
jgi:hypothetical protein